MNLRDYFSLSGSFSRRELALALGILLSAAILLVTLRANFPELISETAYRCLFLSLYPIWGIALGKRSRDLGTTFTYGLILGTLIPIIGLLFLFQAGQKSRGRNTNKNPQLTPSGS